MLDERQTTESRVGVLCSRVCDLVFFPSFRCECFICLFEFPPPFDPAFLFNFIEQWVSLVYFVSDAVQDLPEDIPDQRAVVDERESKFFFG